MLSYLRIRDLALIEDVTVEPGPGLVVLTGETGAGKSILLDGLALLAGQRADLEQIREGSAEANIEGVFGVHGRDRLLAALAAEGLESSDGELVARRSLGPAGSRAYLSDRLVTVRTLRAMGEQLVEIAGQHESQVLLRGGAQLELLDSFGGLGQLRSAVAAAWEEATTLQQDLEALRTDDRDRAQRADYLRYQIEEIRDAGLVPDEEAELAAERRRLRHAEELAESAAAALELLYEGESSVVAVLGAAHERLVRIERLDPSSGLGAATVDEVRYSVEDLSRQLQAYADGLESDPARLDAVEARLSVIDLLRRKYGDTVAEILERADAAALELASLENRDEEIRALEQRLLETAAAYDRTASELSHARSRAAESLQARISEELQDLGMEGARFSVRLFAGGGAGAPGLPPGATRRGYESVEFLLAANPGEPARPLARVASGGELSRITLALKLATSGDAPPPTLVFDEIDAGVGGGRVADRLAQRLAELGGSHQVLVVTHLPQIAARAGTHYRVSKFESSGRTRVQVALLGPEERVEELARMLGGVEVTDSLREHARHLLGDAS